MHVHSLAGRPCVLSIVSVFRVRTILCVTTRATHPRNGDTLQVGQICDGNYFPGLTSDQSGKIMFHRANDIQRERDAGRKRRPTLRPPHDSGAWSIELRQLHKKSS